MAKSEWAGRTAARAVASRAGLETPSQPRGQLDAEAEEVGCGGGEGVAQAEADGVRAVAVIERVGGFFDLCGGKRLPSRGGNGGRALDAVAQAARGVVHAGRAGAVVALRVGDRRSGCGSEDAGVIRR